MMDKKDSAAMERIAADIIKTRKETDIEQDPKRLKHMINTDLRDSIPPQVYAVIGAIAAAIKKEAEIEGK